MERLTRRFLTFDINVLNLSEPIRYERYYISDELRIQKKNNVYEKEVLKNNVVISKEQISFDEFMHLKESAYKEIIRDSYLYLDDERISIKKYYGIYEGLLRVEVDFQSIDELIKYQKEKWMNVEITASPLAFDRDLSKLDREQFLKEFNKNKTLQQTLQQINEDIYICHEFREDVYQRIMILHSDTPIDSVEQDGVMDILFSKEDWYNHRYYWHKYLTSHYLENVKMQLGVIEKPMTYYPLIQECLNQYHDIVFLDVTDLSEEEEYTWGILFLPSSITNKQYNALEENIHYFSQFASLSIEGGCEIKNIWETDVCPIHEDIEGSTFPKYLEETIKDLVKGKHK